jgi:hypothetical protein
MGFVYFLEDNANQVKIGFTKRKVKDRAKEINSPNIKILLEYETSHPTQLEKALHFRFKRFNIEREWFDLSEFKIDEIRQICDNLNQSIGDINSFDLNNF